MVPFFGKYVIISAPWNQPEILMDVVDATLSLQILGLHHGIRDVMDCFHYCYCEIEEDVLISLSICLFICLVQTSDKNNPTFEFSQVVSVTVCVWRRRTLTKEQISICHCRETPMQHNDHLLNSAGSDERICAEGKHVGWTETRVLLVKSSCDELGLLNVALCAGISQTTDVEGN